MSSGDKPLPNFTDASLAPAMEPEDDAKTIIDPNSPGRIYEQPGQVIGRYTLVEVLGEGGFGSVWRAEQSEPVARQVALKIIKVGMDTREVIARFEQERQALAIMDHPNIARVFDAGVTDAGRPYFVMELVKGEPLNAYCDRNRLIIRQRLELFVQVCQAIQHAHQKGVIHRDLKPSNILVTEHDGAPVVRVIDFGVAKATERSLTAETLQTLAGQVIGTPGYMSPEQADPLHQDIDTRSDVYSLGAVLYELLTGTLPLDEAGFAHAALEAILRRIREQDPPRPSNRITSLTADKQATAAQRRGLEPTRLPHAVRGDLDWIVMKCLEKDRQRRYETVSGLAADVQRHLNDEPITARPPSAAYRIRKTVRRNRLAFGAAAVILVLLIAGLVGTSLGMLRARRANEHLAAEKVKQDELLWTASRGDHEAATRAFNEDHHGEGLAYLNRALKYRPMNAAALAASAVHAFGPNAAASRTRSVTAFGGAVNCVAFRHDSLVLAVGSGGRSPGENGEVRVIEAATGKEISNTGFRGGVNSVCFSPNGRYLITGQWNGVVGVIEVATGKEISRTEFGGGMHLACFSPDGRYLAAGSWNQAACVIEVATGKEISRTEFGGLMSSVCFSPDGRYLAAGSWDKTARVIEVATGNQISRTEFGARVTSVSFSPDGRYLSAASSDETVRVIEAATGSEISRTKFGDSGSISFSPDGRYFIAGRVDKFVEAIEMATGRAIIEAEFKELVTSVNFSPDGRFLAVSGYGKTLRVVEVATWKEISRTRVESFVLSVSFSPDGCHLAAGCEDKTMRVIETLTGKEISRTEFGEPVTSVRFSPDGRFLAAGSSDKTARVIEAVMSKEINKVEFPGESVNSVGFSPDGRYIAAGSGYYLRKGRMRVIETVTSQEISTAEFGERVNSVSFSPDGRFLAIGGDDKVARVIEATTGTEISQTRCGNSVVSVNFSPDGCFIAAGSTDNTARVIEAATGLEISQTPFGNTVFSVNFSPDGCFLAAGVYGHIGVEVIEAPTWKVMRRTGVGFFVRSVSFSPDGRFLAAGGDDPTVRITEALTGKEIGKVKVGEHVTSMSFSPDGRFLAVGGNDHTVLVIETLTRKEISRLEFGKRVSSVSFSPGGRFLAVGGDDRTVRIVDCSWLNLLEESSMPWRSALRLLSGIEYQADGRPAPLSADELLAAQREISAFVHAEPNPNERGQHAILKWSQMLPEERTTSPWTHEPIRAAVGRWLMEAHTDTPTITDCADQAPWHPLVPVSLARKEMPDIKDAAQRKVRTTFLARLTLKRLRDADVKLYGAEVLTAYAAKAADWMLELGLSIEATEARALKW